MNGGTGVVLPHVAVTDRSSSGLFFSMGVEAMKRARRWVRVRTIPTLLVVNVILAASTATGIMAGGGGGDACQEPDDVRCNCDSTNGCSVDGMSFDYCLEGWQWVEVGDSLQHIQHPRYVDETADPSEVEFTGEGCGDGAN